MFGHTVMTIDNAENSLPVLPGKSQLLATLMNINLAIWTLKNSEQIDSWFKNYICMHAQS
jgi:hypothetical protein